MRLVAHLSLSVYMCAVVAGQQRPTGSPVPATHHEAARPDASIPPVTIVNVTVNQMAWDPNSQLIYLSVPALDSAGNSVQALDPATGKLITTLSLASSPYSLSVSATGQYLYVGSAGYVQRYLLPSLAQDLVIPLGNDVSGNPYVGGWVEASPVDDRTIAVVKDLSEFAGLFVFDNDVPRASSICGRGVPGCTDTANSFFSVQWNQDASRVFGADNLRFSTAPVMLSGVGKVSDYPGVNGAGNGFGDKIHFDRTTGRVFADEGAVFDASTAALVLRLKGVQLVVPDGLLGKVFGVQQNDGFFTVTSFDIHTGAPLDTVTVFGAGIPVDLIRWGTNGLAVALLGRGGLPSAVYLLSGSFVDSPAGPSNQPFITPYGINPVESTLNAISPGEWVAIHGGNLAGATLSSDGTFPTTLAGTSVTINGIPAYLAYVSPGQIILQAPDMSSAVNDQVVVQTENGTAQSTVYIDLSAPSFLLLDNTHVMAIIHRSDSSGAYGGGTYDILGPTGTSLGFRTVAAKPGDSVSLYAIGLGPTNPHIPAGQPFSGVAPLTNPPKLSIGYATVTPSYSGLSSAGVYQIDFKVPSGGGSGDVPLELLVTGSSDPRALLTLQ